VFGRKPPRHGKTAMLPFIGIALIVLVVATLVAAAMKPDTFRIERSATIKASPERIFSFITNFHNWIAWSPWEKMDPALTRRYSGPADGEGAIYEWKGNAQVGQGRMEIIRASAPMHLVIKLDFLKPFEAHNTAEFTLTGGGGSTHVTWAMYGPHPYMVKVMSLFLGMDKMVGGQFEQGLASLKTVSEREG
jgi:uncharacterized protein YndB with AHSA1/START domain